MNPSPIALHSVIVPARRAVLVCSLGCLVSMAAVGAVSLLVDAPLLFPAIGASAFLAFHAPRAALSSPRNALLGHGLAATVGTLAAYALSVPLHEPWLASAEPWRAVVSGALALSVTGGLMQALTLPHPPAGATTLIVGTGLLGGVEEIGAILASVLVLTVVARTVHRFSGEPYPWWAAPGP